MWIDATSAAGYIYNPKESQVADKTAFTASPVSEMNPNASGWSWAWALGIPASSQKQDAAKSFLAWATSKDYVKMVGTTEGWVAAPPGTRKSTYENADYVAAAPFAKTVMTAIEVTNPAKPTVNPVPYTGVQFVAIPEFQGIGTAVGQEIAAALAGQKSAADALAAAQASTLQTMTEAGYIK
jgi:sorbitol/mannitol transport system substrate-binding protein